MEGTLRDLGPCALIFNNIDLGPTLGDVTFKYTTESVDIKEDQKGKTPIDSIFVGQITELTAPLTRAQLATLASVLPGATLSSASTLRVSTNVGESMYDNAYALIVKPIIEGVISTDKTNWLTILKAAPSADMEVVYNVDGQRVYKAIFKAFPSQATPIGEIWRIG
jgi:hypothetical protein